MKATTKIVAVGNDEGIADAAVRWLASYARWLFLMAMVKFVYGKDAENLVA